ncbi:AAA family ATPase [Phyllobacterium calauticae]|uniref:AAA family ATPase n=1 Tax=Phyllobacterium calauticae TaxID=2817027 RepID=UPI001CBBD68D|nr:AAA family ATPase [Phyllobacterium calauticae]MBZ3691002.1 AAA family ATPase [Phyllobacterium calauticae]
MIKSIEIKNFKSIDHINLELGRVNVFIGENGAGKSNILEAIALASASIADKLDNEFLSSRGVRVTPPLLMRSAFKIENGQKPITISVTDFNDLTITSELNNDNSPYSEWEAERSFTEPGGPMQIREVGHLLVDYLRHVTPTEDMMKIADQLLEQLAVTKARIDEQLELNVDDPKRARVFPITLTLPSPTAEKLMAARGVSLGDFIIYSPENSSLRIFEKEGQILPLGINGEGLLKLLSVMAQGNDLTPFKQIKDCLRLFGWFEDFEIIDENGRSQMAIRDIFLDKSQRIFDQRSANEGFLFTAFYFTLFTSTLTPKFFAIDNIDASLNPKLCSQLMKTLNELAVKNDKQVIFTTHNPAVLDGLNLDDDQQRLFVIDRGRSGNTRIKRVNKPNSSDGYPVRLSESFLSGTLGGLPKRF